MWFSHPSTTLCLKPDPNCWIPHTSPRIYSKAKAHRIDDLPAATSMLDLCVEVAKLRDFILTQPLPWQGPHAARLGLGFRAPCLDGAPESQFGGGFSERTQWKIPARELRALVVVHWQCL